MIIFYGHFVRIFLLVFVRGRVTDVDREEGSSGEDKFRTSAMDCLIFAPLSYDRRAPITWLVHVVPYEGSYADRSLSLSLFLSLDVRDKLQECKRQTRDEDPRKDCQRSSRYFPRFTFDVYVCDGCQHSVNVT